MVRLGQAYAALGRRDAAEWLFRLVLTENPATASAEAELARLLIGRERFREAEELLRSALERQPGADSLYRDLARALKGRGEDRAARFAQAKAGEAEVHLPDPLIDDFATMVLGSRFHLLEGRAAYQAGDFPAAVEAFRAAAAADRDGDGHQAHGQWNQ